MCLSSIRRVAPLCASGSSTPLRLGAPCTFNNYGRYSNLVTWHSKKQTVLARSSAEVELRSLANGICEGIWLQRLLTVLKLEGHHAVELKWDNLVAISNAKNPVHHDRTKHVEVDRHFISEKIETRLLRVNYVPSKSQFTCVLTKALFRPTFEELAFKLGMIDIYHQTWEGVLNIWI